MKLRLRQAVSFDGNTLPEGHVIDMDKDQSGISAECLVQREWADVVTDDTPASPNVANPTTDDPNDDSEGSEAKAEIAPEPPKAKRKK
jgi:hypothetical protein